MASHLGKVSLCIFLFAYVDDSDHWTVSFASWWERSIIFGYALPEIIAPNRELKKIIKEIHEFLSNGFYLLIIFHVAAAFWHHYILKDDSFKRMRL